VKDIFEDSLRKAGMEDTDVIYKTQKKQDRKEQGIRTVRIENK
jgi:hypothetical protein